ncbi:hypothetical protein DFQ27_008769 [Actinomortierella ambigua]|uniref:Uncharacterized protein n=1 Tax=Actinomortierella ambigua TaxID=1343610 RepID=A0A9P6PPS1_9FUNG|nr:hypothetical protein DFQ27_008769 [Actinomortierella ambigua]
MASAAKALAQFYNRQYQKHPILTISVTNALLAGVSDTLTQQYFGPSQPISTTTQHSLPPSDQQQGQWTKDAVATSYGESLTSGLPGGQSQINSIEQENHAHVDKDRPLKGGQQDSAKDSIKGAKDMIVEGSKEIAQNVGRETADMAETKVQELELKAPSLVPSSATVASSTPGMLRDQQKTNQSLEAFDFDFPRLGRFMFYNLAIAPVIHTWYSYIDRAFPLTSTSSPLASGASGRGGGGGGGGGAAAVKNVATQAMRASRNATQTPSLSTPQVPSHSGVTPMPTTSNPTGINPTKDMAKSAVAKAAGAAAAAGSIAGTASTASRSTWLRSTLQPAMRRMLADQVLFAPVGLAMLFTGLTVLEGGGVREVKEKLSESYPTALKANYTIWPVVQLVNFSIMPLQFRLPFVSVVGIAWNAYLSLVNNRGRQAIVIKEQQEQDHVAVPT